MHHQRIRHLRCPEIAHYLVYDAASVLVSFPWLLCDSAHLNVRPVGGSRRFLLLLHLSLLLDLVSDELRVLSRVQIRLLLRRLLLGHDAVVVVVLPLALDYHIRRSLLLALVPDHLTLRQLRGPLLGGRGALFIVSALPHFRPAGRAVEGEAVEPFAAAGGEEARPVEPAAVASVSVLLWVLGALP